MYTTVVRKELSSGTQPITLKLGSVSSTNAGKSPAGVGTMCKCQQRPERCPYEKDPEKRVGTRTWQRGSVASPSVAPGLAQAWMMAPAVNMEVARISCGYCVMPARTRS